jgi:hypothetical protein
MSIKKETKKDKKKKAQQVFEESQARKTTEEQVEAELNAAEQSMKQKKIQLAQGDMAPVLIQLLKDIMQQPELVGKSEFETVRNAIVLDTQATIIRDMVDYLEKIRAGALHEIKK